MNREQEMIVEVRLDLVFQKSATFVSDHWLQKKEYKSHKNPEIKQASGCHIHKTMSISLSFLNGEHWQEKLVL